jgi:signal transduction histidine kinase
MLNTLTAKYLQLADYFIPENITKNRDALNQARMFLISHTMGPFLGNTVPLALYFVDPTPGWNIAVLALSITAFWLFPILMKLGCKFNTLVVTSVLNLNFCIFLSCYYNGGVSSPTLSWILIIPLLSFFYIGGERRLQTSLLLIFGSSFGIFLILYFYFKPSANDIPEYAMIVLGLVSTIATLLYVATMAIYYSRIFDAGVELENEVRRRRRAAEELRLAMAETDRASRMKAEFLARMSHELRTPLNAVVGYSQIIVEDTLTVEDVEVRKDVNKIHEAGQYLVRLINMILDLSKIETGHMKFDIKQHSLNTIVNNALLAAKEIISKKGNQIELFLLNDIDDVETDENRLLEVLNAILRNAGENTENGKITVSCFASETHGARGYDIVVSDTGSGIEESRLPFIFEALVDKRDASKTRYGGTGLNLAVTHRLAAAMGCHISVESIVGKGSTFTISVPSVSNVLEKEANEKEEAEGPCHVWTAPVLQELI